MNFVLLELTQKRWEDIQSLKFQSHGGPKQAWINHGPTKNFPIGDTTCVVASICLKSGGRGCR